MDPQDLINQAKRFIEKAEAFIADPEDPILDDAYCEEFNNTTKMFAIAWFEDESGPDVVSKLFEL